MKGLLRFLTLLIAFLLTQHNVTLAVSVNAGTISELRDRLNEAVNPLTVNITDNLNGGLDIENWYADDLIINGNGYTLDGLSTGSGFSYYGTTSKKISLNNITMKNFVASSDKAAALYFHTSSSSNSIESEITIGDNAKFEENSVEYGSGGAIYNEVLASDGDAAAIISIGNDAVFKNNYAENIGGAIYNEANSEQGNAAAIIQIGDNARFEGNSVGYHGGNIYNRADTFDSTAVATVQTGDNARFEGNSTEYGFGGAICNLANARSSTATATVQIGNNAIFEQNSTGYGPGGAINNEADSEQGDATAIVQIGDGARFEGNSSKYSSGGGAIYNFALSMEGDVEATVSLGKDAVFKNNNSGGSGGAISNQVNTYGSIAAATIQIGNNAIFEGNSVRHGEGGGAIYNFANARNSIAAATVQIGNGAIFEGNSAERGFGGAIYNLASSVEGDAGATVLLGKNVVFKNNNSGDSGGAICNQIDTYGPTATAIMEIGDGAIFEDNSSEHGFGGAIYNGTVIYGPGTSSSEINITTNGGTTKFSNNTDATGLNDVYLGGDNSSLNIRGDSGKVVFESGIANEKSDAVINHSGTNELVLGKEGVDARFETFTGTFNQTAGTTTVYGEMFGGKNNISNSTLRLWQSAPSAGINDLNLDSATVNTANPLNTVSTFNIAAFNAVGKNDFNVNVDGAAEISDKFVIDLGTGDGILNVSNIQFTTVPVLEEIVFPVFEGDISGYSFSATQNKIITPIYKYNLASLGEGNYRLWKDTINENIYHGPSATQAIKQNQALVTSVLFDHIYLDSFMDNKITVNNGGKYTDSSIFGPYQYSIEEGSVWLKNYANIDRLSLTQGLEVNSTTYGSIVGVDFPSKKSKTGWKFVPTAFVGYSGARQGYSDVITYQNGGQAGFMGTVMKNDFISSVLIYAGGYGNEINNAGYKDKVSNWFTGATAKSAYNFRLKKNLILQPSVMVSYNLFGKQKWGGKDGYPNMQQGYFNGINVAPNLNLIYNKDTWSLYLTTMYMYNINDGLSVTANDQRLPDVRLRHGYVEYGIGAIKTFKERLITYGQIVLRNGGRTGVGFQLGGNWLL